jgi:hypothetical protein
LHYTYVLIDPRDESVFYVGKGNGGRLRKHWSYAVRGVHHNRKLQNKISRILDVGLKPRAEKIFEHQDEWPTLVNEVSAIAFYGRESLCNLTDGGEGNVGWKPSPEFCAQRSVIMSGERNPFRGKHLSEEQKAHLSAIQSGENNWMRKNRGEKSPFFGKKLSEEHRARMSASRKGKPGKPLTAETRAKLSAAHSGKTLTEEHKAKLSEAFKGEKNPNFGKPLSEDQKARLSAVNLGKKHSEETKAKMSVSHSGEKHPNFGKELPKETRDKLSTAHLGKILSEEHKKAIAAGVQAHLARKQMEASVTQGVTR